MATIKKEGNTVYIQVGDKMRQVGMIVHGVIASEGKKMTATAVLVVERNRDYHLMNVWQAYGFSKEVMDQKDWFDYVQLYETMPDKKVNLYMIPRKDLILHGREYETDNFERQYFVTLEKLQKYKV